MTTKQGNGWGGKRPGAGRKPKPPAPFEGDPLAFLLAVMRGLINPTQLQVRAAITAARYLHPKADEVGKKASAAEAAKAAGKGRFAPMAAPGQVLPLKRPPESADS